MPGSAPGRPARVSGQDVDPSLGEFDIITKYFMCAGARRDDVLLGIGDDAALLDAAPGALVVTRDATVNSTQGDHDDAGELAAALVEAAGKALEQAGAQPRWATLALTLPAVDGDWLRAFAAALSLALRTNNVALIGGDTTRGPLAVTLSFTGVSLQATGA